LGAQNRYVFLPLLFNKGFRRVEGQNVVRELEELVGQHHHQLTGSPVFPGLIQCNIDPKRMSRWNVDAVIEHMLETLQVDATADHTVLRDRTTPLGELFKVPILQPFRWSAARGLYEIHGDRDLAEHLNPSFSHPFSSAKHLVSDVSTRRQRNDS